MSEIKLSDSAILEIAARRRTLAIERDRLWEIQASLEIASALLNHQVNGLEYTINYSRYVDGRVSTPVTSGSHHAAWRTLKKYSSTEACALIQSWLTPYVESGLMRDVHVESRFDGRTRTYFISITGEPPLPPEPAT